MECLQVKTNIDPQIDALKCREHFERTLVRSEGRSAGSA